jgi:CDP-glucose 4,6-dehydratase
MAFKGLFKGKRVLITGHNGFKGSWLCEWLLMLGAEVIGYSLQPSDDASIFASLDLKNRLKNITGDVRNLRDMEVIIRDTKPDFIFHLAAQPLVRHSYKYPVETYSTNIMGTVNLLEAIRLAGRGCTVIVVTTDKCYENKEWIYSYREEDEMGGFDPYSSSKGSAELIASAYRRSYFSQSGSNIRIATVRAGNVIGGGDWAEDRIVPDCMRALIKGSNIIVRNKHATRPWQHVLEPLSGYLWLAVCLSEPQITNISAEKLAKFNFGPGLASNRSVGELVKEVLKNWPGVWEDRTESNSPHEACFLNLAIDKALHYLNWQPTWNFSETVNRTVFWYRQVVTQQQSPRKITVDQINDYVKSAGSTNSWALD